MQVKQDSDGIVAPLFDLSFKTLLISRIITPRTVGFLYLLALAIILVTQINTLIQQARAMEILPFLTAYLPIWVLVVLLNIFLARVVLEALLLIAKRQNSEES